MCIESVYSMGGAVGPLHRFALRSNPCCTTSLLEDNEHLTHEQRVYIAPEARVVSMLGLVPTDLDAER